MFFLLIIFVLMELVAVPYINTRGQVIGVVSLSGGNIVKAVKSTDFKEIHFRRYRLGLF